MNAICGLSGGGQPHICVFGIREGAYVPKKTKVFKR
ncbi:hypothetical protein CLOBOL_04483 [Enterocloster bolteae ATCC BAA-613]|uniref:Uncharacterized protein n=1 Tax=Enterocloster bolteae (strain ATCC BAA-613 / DSM 15670 / CCUG 46953 / JCM 12243 / WAL 16351) TaxID=411902 RepID=A8RW64_ENTBW|nr:hypothetical protein CLOBOL_04483 [Enterocloster bolteae ATCC BAA-613]